MRPLTGRALLRRLLGPRAPALEALRPGGTAYVIGDVHGMHALLEALLARVDADIARRGEAEPATVIVAGDMIDRGDRSDAVLEAVRGRVAAAPARTVALMGNHERMMIDFLRDPASGRGAAWLRHGGVQTLAAYGVHVASDLSPPAERVPARDALREALPPGMEGWLAALPRLWHRGTLLVSHAGADPDRPPAAQAEAALLWGHPRFGTVPRRDGLWVAHGHVPVRRPRAEGGTVAVDTGAYETGRLTAARLTDGAVAFLTVGS